MASFFMQVIAFSIDSRCLDLFSVRTAVYYVTSLARASFLSDYRNCLSLRNNAACCIPLRNLRENNSHKSTQLICKTLIFVYSTICGSLIYKEGGVLVLQSYSMTFVRNIIFSKVCLFIFLLLYLYCKLSVDKNNTLLYVLF